MVWNTSWCKLHRWWRFKNIFSCSQYKSLRWTNSCQERVYRSRSEKDGNSAPKLRKTKKLGGKGKLTEALMKKLSTYYGLAIRRNINSVEDMKKAIMATYYHMISTDENPRHENCPVRVDSWCTWQQDKALGNELEAHPAPLPRHAEGNTSNIWRFVKRWVTDKMFRWPHAECKRKLQLYSLALDSKTFAFWPKSDRGSRIFSLVERKKFSLSNADERAAGCSWLAEL